MTNLEIALVRLVEDLRAAGAQFALVGGLAVSALAEPRTTRDIDFAIAVLGDDEAERLIAHLIRARGYVLGKTLEHDRGRLSTQRLHIEVEGHPIVVDLLFASSGIEPEVVADATMVEYLPGLFLPLVRPGHLLALKMLAARPQDLADARALHRELPFEELARARRAVSLIARRGFDRGRDVERELEAFVRQPVDEGP